MCASPALDSLIRATLGNRFMISCRGLDLVRDDGELASARTKRRPASVFCGGGVAPISRTKILISLPTRWTANQLNLVWTDGGVGHGPKGCSLGSWELASIWVIRHDV